MVPEAATAAEVLDEVLLVEVLEDVDDVDGVDDADDEEDMEDVEPEPAGAEDGIFAVSS